MRESRLFRTGLLGMAALMVAACGGNGSSDGDQNADGGQSDTPTEVVIAVDTDITAVDCQKTSGLLDRWIMDNYCESILQRDVNSAELVPHIVTEWSVSDDELVWAMTLRDDVYFHNGKHFTATDLKASVERVVMPELESSQGNYWEPVSEVVIIDDYTVEFHLDEPFPLLFVFAERLPLIPSELYEEYGADEYTGDEAVGLGAYVLTSWERDDRVIFEAFDDYFLGRPSIDRVIFRTIPDEAARVAALRAGEVDIIFPVSPHQVDQIESDPDLVVQTPVSLERARVQIDSRRAPFDDVRVRQAVNYALDVQSIIDQLIPGAVQIPNAIVPEEEGYNDQLEPYPFDPERARQLLADAGHADGIGPVEFSVSRGYANGEEIAQAIAANLSDVGIRTELRVYDSGDFNTRKREKFDNPDSLGPLQFDAHAGGNTFHSYHHLFNVIGCAPADGGIGSPVHSGYYCNPELDEIVNQGVELWTSDNAGAIAALHDAQRIVQEDAWAGFLFQMPRIYGVRADLNWESDASGQLKMRLASWN